MTETVERQQRFERGKNVLEAIDGEAGANVINALDDISPELGHQVVAWGSARSTLGPASNPETDSLSRSAC